jgi:hypothetical protein
MNFTLQSEANDKIACNLKSEIKFDLRGLPLSYVQTIPKYRGALLYPSSPSGWRITVRQKVETLQKTEFTHQKLAIFHDDALWMCSKRIGFFFLKRVTASSREESHTWFSVLWYGLDELIREAPLICDGGSGLILETLLRISIILSRIDQANNDYYPTKPHYRLQQSHYVTYLSVFNILSLF